MTSFEAAFEVYWQKLFAVVYRVVGDRAEAEDLALDVFWRLHRRMSEPGAGPVTAAWLYRVAVNVGLNALRAKRRRSSHEEAAAQWTTDNRAVRDPLELAAQAEERRRVRAVLARLRPRSARLLVLRYSGLSYAELAAALDLAPSSIGSLLSRAEKEFEHEFRKAAR